MIRTKAKNLLLGIMLLLACFVFFACKEETRVEVESIGFTEQSIQLLVGEQYSPIVKVLPSYATSRSYTLISSDVTALSIEGGTITALKPSLDVKLKVISDENENINDVISVNIYSEAVELDVPSELNFDGNKFTFVGKDNANSYVLNVNGQEINIGNNTEYAFENVLSKINDLRNQIVVCKVKSSGDGKIFKDSQYSQEISFVKLSSVDGVYVQNETLYFNAIKNVASYNIGIVVGGKVIENKTVSNLSFDEMQLSLDISDLTDSVNGAEYVLQITPNLEGYNALDSVNLFGGKTTNLDYYVIGSVKNIAINDRVISWDFVKNAQSYTVEIYKDNALLQKYENINTNYIQIAYQDAGEYYCKVLANSNIINSTTGKEYSSPLLFTILATPEISINNNSVSWTSIDSAEGYLVTIKNGAGSTMVDKSFVLGNMYDVSNFGAGDYSIQVTTCGNNGNGENVATLSSKASGFSNWTVLQGLQLSIQNQKLYWQDADNSTLNKYHIAFNDVDKVLTTSSYDNQYKYDTDTKMFSFDLSAYDFAVGNHTITIKSLGENNVFDAKSNSISLTKLGEGSISSLTNKQFILSPVDNASSYKIEIYNANSLNNAIITLDNMIGGYKFDLDTSLLEAGNYVAKVFVFGNGTNVFDAENLNDGTTINFEKLSTPTIYIDNTNLKLIVDKDGEVANAVSYKLFENSKNKNISDNEYDLSNLTAGDYIYSAQAVGNNSNILDSELTLTQNQISVKKLATPTISFDKSKLIYTIECDDNDFVGKYEFTLNEQSVSVVNNQANCSTLITTPQTYQTKVYATPKDVSAGYNLVIASATQTYSVSKLDGLCDFQISNGKLIVTPSTTLTGSGYDLNLRIDNGDNDIILTDFVYTGSRFETSLHDAKYNTIEEISTIMQSAGQYQIFTTISQNNDNVVTSNEAQSENVLKVLDKVSTIAKNQQSIEFNVVENATNYIAIITLLGTEHYIDINENYSITTNNVIQMQDLLQLMDNTGVAYRENTAYEIKFVSTNDDTRTLFNKGINSYSFEFLKSPVLSIIERENNVKYLSIDTDDVNISNYQVAISQDKFVSESELAKQSDGTVINMDNMSQLVNGNVKIVAYGKANTGDYFNSKTTELNVTKLDSTTITISKGLLEWNVVANAKQYNLAYTNAVSSGFIALTEGVENFTIQGGKCVYNFDTLESNLTDMYLQIDSETKVGNNYYLNSNNGTPLEDIYKLPTLEIKVVNGEIYTEVRKSDLTLTEKIAVVVNNELLNLDITNSQNEDITVVENGDKLEITISPNALFTYGENELLLENLRLKSYSNSATTLNSSTVEKNVFGLLSPTNLDITTSATPNSNGVIEDVFEKITWNNPQANGNYVVKYEIIINYNGVDYIINSTERAPQMPSFYDDNANGNLDEGEVEFGAGVYSIKVRAITDNCDNIVNSKYCQPITIKVLETPTGLGVKNGNVVWTNDSNAGYYLLKVYLLNGNKKEIIVSSQANVNEFDLTTLNPFNEGVYGVSVQAMHNNSRILSSKESEIFQVVRLPQVEKYYVKNGELYIRVHSFYKKAEIYLTDKQTGATTYTFTMYNDKSNDNIKEYISNGLFATWSSSNIISTYTNDNYFIDVKYAVEDDATLRTALAEDYSLSVKLFGNTISSEIMPEGACVGAIISGHTSNQAINTYWENDDNVVDKNVVEKLVTPTVEVSSTQRGVMLVNIPNGLNYSLNYYVDGQNSLQGVHLYEVNISTDNKYTLYVAEIVDNALFEASLTAVGSELIVDNQDRNNLKHFEYNGIAFNVIEQNAQGYIPFDFTENYYYYYDGSSGEYTYIDLTIGGSFVVSVRFIGDDSRFVQSNMSDTVTIKRYNILNLTISNGTMSWLNQATSDDHPIYLITLTNENETYNLVLYNPEYHTEQDLYNCLESDKSYIFDTITYVMSDEMQDELIVYKGLADVINTARKNNSSNLVGLGGTFFATIKAHYTDNTSMDIILAQGGESKTVAILPQSILSVVDGALNWNMSYVTNTGGREYINNYLLQVFDGESKLYETTLKAGDYNVYNHNATYQLPQQLNNGVDSVFNFVAGSSYVFKLMALGMDSNSYINSIVSSTNSTNILPNLQDVRMENGVLTWTNTTSSSVEIHVSYVLGDATVTFIVTETDNTFELPSSFTDTTQTLRYLIAGYDYHIKARLKGQTTSLNGFFSNEIVAHRLPTISTDSIATNNGVLTWKADELEGAKYTISYTLANGTTNQTEMLDINSFNFEGVGAGVIKVKVFAHHNNHFSAFASEQVELFKLGIPANITYNEGSTTISWDKVVDKDGNPVENYLVIVAQEGVETQEYKCETNQWVITGVASNKFSIAVKAIDTNVKGATINGEYSDYQSMELPNQVDVTTFEFDQELQAFKWKAINGEQSGDKYYINYDYYDSILAEGDNVQPSQIVSINVTKTKQVNGEKYYYFYPTAIGSYRSIYVQVQRLESLSSQKTWCMANETDYYKLDFDLFASGEGTVAKPYIISNERHLRNIVYFLDANYELNANIALTSNLPITNANQVFTGSINGNKDYYISGVTNTSIQTFDQSGYVGLFNKVKGATFKNINLSNFELKGYLNSSRLYMGILVGYAESETLNGITTNSVFQNITITSSTIELVKNNRDGYNGNSVDMYIGAIVGYAESCEFENCIVSLGNSEANIIISIKGNSLTTLGIGAISGFANNCKLNSNTIEEAFVIQKTLIDEGVSVDGKITMSIYIGALIGEVGANGVTLGENTCSYYEREEGDLTSKTNKIGNQN